MKNLQHIAKHIKQLVLLLFVIYPNSDILYAQPFTANYYFKNPDSLNRDYIGAIGGVIHLDTSCTDTTNTCLWQIGNTNKIGFIDSVTIRGIMTDTINAYPINSNSWFTLYNFTIDSQILDLTTISFTHKYNTTKGKDGGLLEYSNDSGKNWINIFNSYTYPYDSNIYSLGDTLFNGMHGFSGNSNGWVSSKVIIDSNVDGITNRSVYIRFRFISDSNLDSLAGWIIKDILISMYINPEKIELPNNSTLQLYPNPINNELNILNIQSGTIIRVFNVVGSLLFNDIVNDKQIAINTSKWNTGTYQVELILPDGSRIVRKLVK